MSKGVRLPGRINTLSLGQADRLLTYATKYFICAEHAPTHVSTKDDISSDMQWSRSVVEHLLSRQGLQSAGAAPSG